MENFDDEKVFKASDALLKESQIGLKIKVIMLRFLNNECFAIKFAFVQMKIDSEEEHITCSCWSSFERKYLETDMKGM